MTVASAMLFYIFLDRPNVPNHLERASIYTEQMFDDNHLADLPYPIAPNDVHLYEDQLQININVFSFFDEEGKARHPLFISRKQYPRTANLLYWDEHYAPITDINRLFNDLTKNGHRTNMCLRCLGHFKRQPHLRNTSVCAPARTSCPLCMCFRLRILSRLISSSGNSATRITAPFVIYADFESILEPMDRRVKQTLFNQQHKISAACAMLVSTHAAIPTQTWLRLGRTPSASF